jgi:AraC family transcriptional regulator, regulatory protein of adaptative response / methylated-DNA-[protein]-cysteine methyltransferase
MQITDRKNIQKYYTALLRRDPEFTGTFFVGVKTTGVFCIPTCRARKPKLENVEFFTEIKDGLRNGYRPCKICRPDQNTYKLPEEVSLALNIIKENPREKVYDFQLRQAGLKPENIRRWFKKYYGVTFQGYQRMIRINTAFQELLNGNNVTDSALESGYESLSGFGYMFKKVVGSPPKQSKDKNIILITKITTLLGPMFACAAAEGICLLEFTDRRMLESEFLDLQKRLNAIIINGENDHLIQLSKELAEYFNGSRREFSVKLITPGSDFQQSVWNSLNEIPYGETRSYNQQAVLLNKPNAVRAVASANGHNRIAIVIPCHRVIGKNGKLTGYSGGLERKKWLIEHEKNNKVTS